jgi:hypothetical protein
MAAAQPGAANDTAIAIYEHKIIMFIFSSAIFKGLCHKILDTRYSSPTPLPPSPFLCRLPYLGVKTALITLRQRLPKTAHYK